MRQRTPVRSWQYVVTIGAIAVAYIVAARMTFALLKLGIEASPVWYPAGISLAALLLRGRYTWVGVTLGALLFNRTLDVSMFAAIGSAVGVTLQTLVGATLLRRLKFQLSLDRLQDALGLIICGGVISTIINASIGTITGALAGNVAANQMSHNWGVVWLGDSMGILVVTPLLLTGQTWFTRRWQMRQAFEAAVWLLLLCLVSGVVFYSDTGAAIAEYPLEYLPLPFVIWGALRFGAPGAALGSFLLSSIAIWGTAQDYGPFVSKTAAADQVILLLQAFMGVITITALVLAAAVTERQRTEDLLRCSEASLANAQRIAQLGNWDFDTVQQQWRWSTELYRLLGLHPHQIPPGRGVFLQTVHPDDRDRVRQAMDTALMQKQPYNIDYRIVLPDGSIRIVEEQVDVWSTCITGTVQDITARKRAETALHDSQEKFSKAFCSSPDSISISTLIEGQYLEVNETFLRTTGYTREQVIGRTTKELKIWANSVDRDRLIHLLQQGNDIRNQEFEFCRKSGETGVALVSAEIIHLGGEPCLLCVTRDITERKRVEEQMRLTAERDRLLGEMALRIRRSLDLSDILNTTVAEVRQFLRADRVFISHYDGTGTGRVIAESVAPGWTPALGWATDVNTYREIELAFQRDRHRIVDDTALVECTPFLQEYYTRFQVRASIGVPIMLSDRLFGVLVVNQCSSPRYWQPVEVDLLDQLAMQVAIAIQQGQLYHQVQALNSTLEQQVAERTEQLQQKMEELQDLNQLNEFFLHAVAHDLRTTVMGTLLVLRNLQKQPGDTVSLCRPMLERMIGCGEVQLSKLNSLLEAYTSKTEGIVLQQERLPLPTLIQDVLADLSTLFTQNCTEINNQVPIGLPFVFGDVVQLRRVFEHLLTNAVKHNPPGVQVTLTATVKGTVIHCMVQDNGIGMSQEQCDRLFELRIGGAHDRQLTGISLGLYLCHQIITAHGGEIGVISSPGQGTTVWLTLPLLTCTAIENVKKLQPQHD